jgi:hypothetical protein
MYKKDNCIEGANLYLQKKISAENDEIEFLDGFLQGHNPTHPPPKNDFSLICSPPSNKIPKNTVAVSNKMLGLNSSNNKYERMHKEQHE